MSFLKENTEKQGNEENQSGTAKVRLSTWIKHIYKTSLPMFYVNSYLHFLPAVSQSSYFLTVCLQYTLVCVILYIEVHKFFATNHQRWYYDVWHNTIYPFTTHLLASGYSKKFWKCEDKTSKQWVVMCNWTRKGTGNIVNEHKNKFDVLLIWW